MTDGQSEACEANPIRPIDPVEAKLAYEKRFIDRIEKALMHNMPPLTHGDACGLFFLATGRVIQKQQTRCRACGGTGYEGE